MELFFIFYLVKKIYMINLILNFAILSLILYFFILSKFKYVKISPDIFILLLIHFLSIFIINDTLNNIANFKFSSYFPDQIKYTSGVELVRNSNFNSEFIYYNLSSNNWYNQDVLKGAVAGSAFFFSFFPFFIAPSDFSSIIFINFLLFLFLFLFIFKNFNIPKIFLFIFLFLPSIYITHSLALKDMPLIFFTFFFLVYLLKKNFFISFLFLLSIYMFRENYFYLCTIFYFIYVSLYLILKYMKRIKKISLFLYFSLIISLLIISQNQILDFINNFRDGYFKENNIQGFKFFDNYIDIFYYLFINVTDTILLVNPSNIMQFISTIENIFIYLVILFLIFRNKLIFSYDIIMLLVFYLINIFLITLIISNYGAIDRYKLAPEISLFLIVIIYSYNYKNFKKIND